METKPITVQVVKDEIVKYKSKLIDLVGITEREEILFDKYLEILDTFHDAKLPTFSNELIDFLELKLESEKASSENYEVNAPDDVFEDSEVKKLYHKDMIIANDLEKLINYIKSKTKQGWK